LVKAAVVEAFGQAPRYREFNDPVAQPGEVIVQVRAAALSQLVRAQAAGKHYASGIPPLVPGVDGVGELETGQRVYFAFGRYPFGSMAERVAVNSAYVVPLAHDLDDITAAAMANPGMSSWSALTRRARLQRGESVLVNGANGASGRLAIKIAKHLGAGRVIATARNPSNEASLRGMGADAFIPLQTAQALATDLRSEIERGIDIVLDYLWGPSAEAFFAAVAGHGSGSAAPRIRYVNLGSISGASIELNAGTLRSSGIEVMGSGLGSLSHLELMQVIAEMFGAAKAAQLTINTEARPLADVGRAWEEQSASRIVFTV
jgi:NADPH:quinone reductase-like Zn-dependent oxidoreductase